MQTPYLLISNASALPDIGVGLDGRTRVRHACDGFDLLLFPPSEERHVEALGRRVHVDDTGLSYEDGFMLRYPEPYVESAAEKLALFDVPSIELDGFFSRVTVRDGRARIDGSGMYLQTLYSATHGGATLVSNHIDLLTDCLGELGVSLSINQDFFANHFFNYSLAYYAFSGSPYREIRTHDSLETVEIADELTVTLHDKFSSPAVAALSHEERVDLLHARVSHALAEYCKHVDVDPIGHNLTGGRDSRVSFAMFFEQVRDRLEVVTGGSRYTHDRVISNHVVKRFGLKARDEDEPAPARAFDYRANMRKTSGLEWFIPMFRKIHVSTRFDDRRFVASGYLGNVITFTGDDRNQVVLDNRFSIEQATFDRLMARYREKVAALEAVYGDDAYAMFNVMYNTTNKVASVCRRLKQHTFCIFELDLFQLCYLLESPEERKAGSLHYDLTRRANEELLLTVPFEVNKSFEAREDTFELQGFVEAASPRPYKRFLEKNLGSVIDHLLRHRAELPYLADGFYATLRGYIGEELPPLHSNKVYAALGALEFKGIRYASHTAPGDEVERHAYDMNFFERLYLDNQLYACGLPGMVYGSRVAFKTFLRLGENETFRASIRSAIDNSIVETTLIEDTDGYRVSAFLPAPGKFRVFLSKLDRETKVVTQLYKTSFVSKEWKAAA